MTNDPRPDPADPAPAAPLPVEPVPDTETGTVPFDGGSTVQQNPEQVRTLISRSSSSLPRLSVPGYHLLEEIGRGAMGVVYRAHHIKLNRDVALKMILTGAHAGGDARTRFDLEAETIARLQHTGIVQIFEVGDCDGLPFCAIELCSGGTLAAAIEGTPQDPHSAALRLKSLASAMQTVHAAGIVHRDLKPGNVLLTADGTLKITDFGLAKWLEEGRAESIDGQVLGSPSYMAPEQAAGRSKEVGPPADVWSLGAILYELLVGRPPFRGASVQETLKKVIADDPVPVRKLQPRCPRDLQTICLKCLAKDPRRRYESAGELAADLDRFLAGRSIAARPPGRAESLTRWVDRHRWQSVAALLVVGLAGIALVPGTPKPAPVVVVRPEPEESPMLRHKRGEVTRRAEFLLRVDPRPDRDSPHPVEVAPEIAPLNRTAFRVLDDDRVVDLRGWKKLAPGEDPSGSAVINTLRQKLAKVEPVDAMVSEARTTGSKLVMRSLGTNSATARVVVPAKKFEVAGEAMTVVQVHTDVSDVPLFGEFERHVRSTYFGSLQTPGEQWFGVIGTGESVKVAMLMLFPEEKPFVSWKLSVAGDDRKGLTAYTGPRIVFTSPDNRWLYWEISEPEPSRVYRVDWEW